MIGSLGDFNVSTVVDFSFTTVDAAGAPTTLSGSPVVKAYKDNATGSEITTGITLTVDHDSVTGNNHVRVDTSADGTFYSAGSTIILKITTGTVDGTSVVGYVVGLFTIEKTSALRPTTAGRTLAIEPDGMAHADLKEWLGTAPLSLTSQRVEALVGAIANNAITAAAIATGAIDADAIADNAIDAGAIAADAITAAKIADGAIDANTFAANAITATAIAADAITAAKIASDAITAAKIADGAIDAATFAANAITATAIAADAITDAKVASDVTIAAVTGAVGSVTGNVGGNVSGSVGSVTGNVGGNVTGSVGSVATGGITAASIASDAIGTSELSDAAANKIADHILRRALADARASADGDAVVFRSILGAMSKLVNKVAVDGADLEIFDETDAGTPFGVQAITTNGAAEPITALDTAG